MVWYETLTCRYFNDTKKEVENFVESAHTLGEVLDFLEKHNLKKCDYLSTLDQNIEVSISIVDNALIITI